MALSFQFHRIAQLPPMAWLARFDWPAHTVTAVGGSSVVVGDRWLFEGAWAGEITAGGFIEAQTSFGSGIRVDEDRVVLSPPTSTLECVFFYLPDESCIWMSNTSAGLLAVVSDGPDLHRTNYLRLFEAARFGLDAYLKKIPMAKGNLQRILYHPLAFSADGGRQIIERPGTTNLASYAAYRAYVANEMAQVMANAADASRPFRYRPLTTISSGYDSPAVAVLAKDSGCTHAVSFATAREQFDAASDSGQDIAATLDLSIQMFDRLDYLKHDQAFEAEFLCSGVGGEDIVFASFGEALSGTCVFTGFAGDKIWGLDDPNIGMPLVRGDNGGGSMQEFRVGANFVHGPVPFVASLSQVAVRNISVSAEMKPWRIGGEYDRPIARRIVEDAGVARALFGQSKKAVTQAIGFPTVFSFDSLSAETAAEYRAFLAGHGLRFNVPGRGHVLAWRSFDAVAKRLVWRKPGMGLALKRMTNIVESWNSRLEPLAGESVWLYHWAMKKRAEFYAGIPAIRSKLV